MVSHGAGDDGCDLEMLGYGKPRHFGGTYDQSSSIENPIHSVPLAAVMEEEDVCDDTRLNGLSGACTNTAYTKMPFSS